MMKKVVLLVIPLLCFFVNAIAQKDPDDRIKKQLDRMELNYDIISTGDFKLLFELDSGRTQIVFISTSTNAYQDVEIREISSPVILVKDKSELTKDQLWMLLDQSFQSILGAWQLEPYKEGWGIHFAVKIPAVIPDIRMNMYLSLVARRADDMEKVFSKEDVY